MISIAAPTGALLKGSLDLLRRAGIADFDRERLGRKLLAEDGQVRLVLVRPVDVAAYVDHGAADLGIVGKDSLWEATGVHYELVDLGFGGCTLVVAVPESSPLVEPRTWPPAIRLATKYPRASQVFLRRIGQSAEIVRLHGSVELAPLVGLVDGIVDLTDTGQTLRENNLRVVVEVGHSTARLIANQAAVKTRSEEVQSLAARIREAVR